MSVTAQDALAELEREERTRAVVYPRWIADGRLTRREVDRRNAAFARAIAIVRAEAEKERLL